MQVNDQLPDVQVQQLIEGGEVAQINLNERAKDKTIVLVGVPGAFTPTCNDTHVPGYIANIDAFKDNGVDEIIILSVADFFVMKKWSDSFDADEMIQFIADGSARFTHAAGLALDLGDMGLGVRCHRFAAIVEDGVITSISVEPNPGVADVSTAEAVLKQLEE